jgi:hypothetical protein
MRICIIATAVLLCFALIPTAFSKTTNATVGETVSDVTGALTPGVQVTFHVDILDVSNHPYIDDAFVWNQQLNFGRIQSFVLSTRLNF